MLNILQKTLLTFFSLSGICDAASYNCKENAVFVYAPKPQTIAVYIASYYDELNLTLIAKKILNDITPASLTINDVKNIVHTLCAEKAKENPHKSCFIELFTHEKRIRSTFTKDYHIKECEPFNPCAWTIMLAYPEGKNHLALFLDLKKLCPFKALEE